VKGILLCGGKSTRLYPTTKAVNKHLLPVYDKPMIYYSLSILILAGVRNILVISTPDTIPLLKKLLRTGSQWGIELSYMPQTKPKGIADAFLVGERFIGQDSVFLVLGDNIIYGHGMSKVLQNATHQNHGATIFAYSVKDPERYGVVDFDADGRAISLEEKPENPKSSYAVPGMYVYDNQAVGIAKSLTPSARGELEITDVNKVYMEKGELYVQILGRGIAWLDAGTPNSLLRASNYVQAIEERQGILIADLDEIAHQMGYIIK